MNFHRLCMFLHLYLIKNVHSTFSYYDVNTTRGMRQPIERQLDDFKLRNPNPIGVLTTSSGKPVDIRETNTLNTDFINNEYFLDHAIHLHSERVPERLVHAKGTGAFGYFEVTHDVSKYSKADVFNGIGKKTPLAARFSGSIESLGGNDVAREQKGLSLKLYTKEGNLDLLCLNIPVYFYKQPQFFTTIMHGFKNNPATHVRDSTSAWDFLTLRPATLHAFFYVQSDFGLPNSYRRMHGFPIHAFELYNKRGERYYARFSLISEQGLQYLTTEEAEAINDPNYFIKDLYNNIALKNYPSWRVQMDVMSLHDLKHIDYDPFDVTRLWKNGTFITVPIGRVVLNRNPDNHFRNVELSAYNPGNVVPGIDGVELLFKGRRLLYRDTQNYRLGINHHHIDVNSPNYAKTYNRDGIPPVNYNMKDVPNYIPNSFNGPLPYVDISRPKDKLLILQSNAVDLEPLSEFYNIILPNDAARQRFVDNLVTTLAPVTPSVIKRAVNMFTLIDRDLARRVLIGLQSVERDL